MATENFDTELEEALLSGGASGNGVYLDVEGVWIARVTEATYGKSQKGDTSRAQVKVEIAEALNGSADRKGASTNLYISTVKGKEDLSKKNIAPWYVTMKAVVGAEKLLYEAADHDDIIQNIVTQITKSLKLGKEIYVRVQTRSQNKVDDKGRPQFWKNVFVFDREKDIPSNDPIDNAPAVENDPFN